MNTSLSSTLRVAAQRLARATEASAPREFAEVLGRIVAPDFSIRATHIVDADSVRGPDFAAVVYCNPQNADHQSAVKADDAAAIIDLIEQLTVEELHASYARIVAAKQLRKTKVPTGENRTNITLGIIYSRRTIISLEVASEELYRLNSETLYSFWPDMIVIDSIGVINYAVQFPGEGVSGDFLPPAEGAFQRGAPPIYVVIVMRPMAADSFTKMAAFLIAHLQLFAPHARSIAQMNWGELLDDLPKLAVTVLGFQPNLQGQIVPVPRDEYADRFMPQAPVAIEDQAGNVLSTIAYRSWQDGAVILSTGKLPLEGLLVFLPSVSSQDLRVIRRPEIQLSYILPISRVQFEVFLSKIEQRSNLVIKRNTGGFVIQKLMDEGVGTPFIARCYMGLLRLRENAFPEKSDRDAFDKIYEPAMASLSAARTAAKDLSSMWTDHLAKIESGESARIEGNNIHILDNVDKKLGSEFETFLNSTNRGLKTGLQTLCNFLGVDLGFLFKKQSAFENGLAKLRATDPALADYLEQARTWTETLVKTRNDLEHSLWSLPKVSYSLNGGHIDAKEPIAVGLNATEFADHYFDRLACFFEEVVAHLLQRKMPPGVTTTEIDAQRRTADAPERFRITPDVGGGTPWRVQYHNTSFDEA